MALKAHLIPTPGRDNFCSPRCSKLLFPRVWTHLIQLQHPKAGLGEGLEHPGTGGGGNGMGFPSQTIPWLGKDSSRQRGCRSSSSLQECCHTLKAMSWTLGHPNSTSTGRKSPGTKTPGCAPTHPDPEPQLSHPAPVLPGFGRGLGALQEPRAAWGLWAHAGVDRIWVRNLSGPFQPKPCSVTHAALVSLLGLDVSGPAWGVTGVRSPSALTPFHTCSDNSQPWDAFLGMGWSKAPGLCLSQQIKQFQASDTNYPHGLIIK